MTIRIHVSTAAALLAAFATAAVAQTHPATMPAVPLAPTTSPAGTPAPAPPELAKLIKDAIGLLDAGKNKEAIQLLADPTVVKRETDAGNLDQMVADFAKSKAPELLAALKKAQTQMPVLSGNNQVAEYPTEAGARPLQFTLLGGAWRLK